MISLWCLPGIDVDDFLFHGGTMASLGFPANAEERRKMEIAIGALPEDVANVRLGRLARFMLMMQTSAPCTCEADLRRLWRWSAPSLQ
jgi:hypothetical protein